MGQLVKLVIAVIIDVKEFFVFICVWVFMFSLFYLVLGFEFDHQIGLMSFYDSAIAAWKISTKGSDTEVTSIWMKGTKDYKFMDTIIMIL